MKKIIFMICLIAIGNCYCQSKKSNKQLKKNKMEYFNIDKYKDWEIDNDYSSKLDDKFLKKGIYRIRIFFDEDTIQLEETSSQNPYSTTKVYYVKSKLLKSILYEFYTINIDTYRIWDETGKLINEIDYDKLYKFSLKEVIEKVKKEYEVDLEDLTQRCVLERFQSDELNNKSFYGVSLRDKENPSKINYILLDGTTGETLFTTYFILRDESIPPFAQYLESLKKAKAEKTAYYKTYKGKDYTKEEWDAFEEEWYQDYQKKKNSKGFWDDIFSRP